jgi:hypothetical protein
MLFRSNALGLMLSREREPMFVQRERRRAAAWSFTHLPPPVY